jgi:hypothetical protein
VNKRPGLYQMWVVSRVMGVEALARPKEGILAQRLRTLKEGLCTCEVRRKPLLETVLQ